MSDISATSIQAPFNELGSVQDLAINQLLSMIHMSSAALKSQDQNFDAYSIGQTLEVACYLVRGLKDGITEREVRTQKKQPASEAKDADTQKKILKIYDNLTKLIEAQDGVRYVSDNLANERGEHGRESFAVSAMADLVQNLTNDIAKNLDDVVASMEAMNGVSCPSVY